MYIYIKKKKHLYNKYKYRKEMFWVLYKSERTKIYECHK